MKSPAKLLEFFSKGEIFFIATHINPDGDALGSSVALSFALESMGKKTRLYDKDTVPDFYRFLPGIERFTNSLESFASGPAGEGGPAGGGQISNLVLLDCNDLERGGIKELAFTASAVIDHHETEKEFGDIRWIDPAMPATGMMVFYLIRDLGLKITTEIATNLYTAIAIDTGTFRYSNTSAEVLRIAAELIELGANPSFIAENIYETWSENRFRLLLKSLDTLEIHDGVAFALVTLDMFRETGANVSDTENFPGFPRMLKSIKVSALVREMGKDYYKVSLRSKGRDINVAKIAESFGGGGHRNAAGFKIRADLKTAKDMILKALLPRSQTRG